MHIITKPLHKMMKALHIMLKTHYKRNEKLATQVIASIILY